LTNQKKSEVPCYNFSSVSERVSLSLPRVLRSMLFVPGNSWRMLMGSGKEGADAVIIDLEDAVPIGEKETARVFARDSVDSIKAEGVDVFVRVNSVGTGLTADDIKAVTDQQLDGVMLPKAESKEELLQLDRWIEQVEKERGLKPCALSVIPTLETAKGVLNAYEIAVSSKRIIALSFGAADFLRDMGRSYATMSTDENELLYARSQISIAARSAAILAIDTPFLGLIIDEEGLIRESKIALQLGFKGKMAIHPKHIGAVNQLFTPSSDDVSYAEKVIKTYEEAAARGLGAASLEGRMIDYATYRMAKELNLVSKAIAEKEKRRYRAE